MLMWPSLISDVTIEIMLLKFTKAAQHGFN